ncbi:MAG: hypothetical protein JXO51_04860 [Candidatus Aminicenantes bacterium]|nr:hypothetical protein [Candidatus Aminicenantes bacterium]
MKKTSMFILIFLFLGAMAFAHEFKKVPKGSSIKVLHPTTGDKAWTGDFCEIRWEKQGLQPITVDIFLIKPEGGVELVIAEGTNNDGKYQWSVPYNLPGMQYKVKVKASPQVMNTGEIFDLNCCLKMTSISKTSGRPGDTFEMVGKFGPEQGVKVAVLNKGTAYELIVVSWSHTKLVVQIPNGLAPGTYKTGVYCSNPCTGGTINTWCMVWRDFEVLPLSKPRKRSVRE